MQKVLIIFLIFFQTIFEAEFDRKIFDDSQATSLFFFNSKLNVKNERENVDDRSAKSQIVNFFYKSEFPGS